MQRREHLGDKAQYLRDNEIVPNANDASPPTPNDYSDMVTYGLSPAGAAGWIERRHARLEYKYRPPFFRHVYGGEASNTAEYLSMDHPEPAFTPNYQNESRVVTRGEGERLGSLKAGYPAVLTDMSRLLNDGRAMPAYMTDAELIIVRDSLWAGDTDSLWRAK